MSFGMGVIQDILKRRLTRFVLAIWNLVNSQTSKTLQHEMSIGMYNNVRAYCAHWYIQRGLQCCCLDVKAIPEPQIAEQQDCSPAFCLCMYLNKRKRVQVWLMKKQARGMEGIGKG